MDIKERQRAAFAIAANMAQSQFAKAVQTQYFFELWQNGKANCNHDALKALITKLRNFFSHTEHAEIDALSADEKAFFEGLYAIARAQLLARKRQNTKRSKQIISYLSGCNFPIITFDGKLSELPQYAIAFMLAPFLSKAKAHQLCQRIYYGKDGMVNSNGAKRDSDKTIVIKALIRQVAHPDSISLRAHDDNEAQWLTSAQIWALTLWDRLDQHYQSGQYLPERYYYRQLVNFIEFQGILPCRFEYTTATTSEADGKTIQTQQRTFVQRGESSPNIKCNTIASEWDGGVKGTFSIKALEIIILAYLTKLQTKQDIADKVGKWLVQNQNYEHKKPAGRNRDEDLDDAIKNRCDYLIRKYEALKPSRNHDQIRFICQRIAVAWEKSCNNKPNIEEYEDLRERVHSFNKEELFVYLNNQGVKTDSSGIELGRGNDKILRKAITKEDINGVYNDMAKAYCDYLKGVLEGLHKRNDDEKNKLVRRLNCRIKPVYDPQNRPNFPVGIPPKLLRYMLLDGKSEVNCKKPKNAKSKFKEKHEKKLENSVKSLQKFLPFSFPKPERNQSAEKKPLQTWMQKQISLAMAWHILSMIPGTKQKVRRVEGFLPLVDIPITLKIGNRSIAMKMGESWRKHTHFPKGYLENLIKYYAGDKKQVPMFRIDEAKGDISIETAIHHCEQERLFLIRAALRYEADWRRKNKANIANKTNAEGYIEFREMCDNPDANDYRRDAFHGRVRKFSDCPEPLKSLYDDLVKKKQEHQNRAKEQNWARKK